MTIHKDILNNLLMQQLIQQLVQQLVKFSSILVISSEFDAKRPKFNFSLFQARKNLQE